MPDTVWLIHVNMDLKENKEYKQLLENISRTFQKSKNNIVTSVNSEMLLAYWNIGKYIIEFEQKGKSKAEYGKQLILNLSKDLTQIYGKGFSRSNLQYMRILYNFYPKSETLSGKLTWSHYIELISIDDKLGRDFYEKQAISEKWSIRELKRQKKTGLFHRLLSEKIKTKFLNFQNRDKL